MKNLLAVVIVLVFFSGLAASSVYYDVESVSDQEVQVNATLTLQCSNNCPVNRWSLKWQKPGNSELVEIRDSLGPIEDYSVENDTISIRTNSGPRRNNETVRMVFDIDKEPEHIYGSLYKGELSLASLSGRKTSGVLEVENLQSGKTGFGFDTSFEGDKMYFQGDGPVYLRYKYGEGRETKYFSFFGDYRENASDAYEIPVGTLGTYQEFERFPVAVLPDENYDESINPWSAGEYVSGSMHIRESLGEDFLPVLAHEVVHGLNDRQFKWDSTRSSYIDEGISEHVEYLVRKKKGLRNSNLFGEKLSYRERVNGTLYRFERPSKGSKDKLWQYYQNDEDFMKTWNAFDSPEENRLFGYAYSELIIKNYLANMNGSLRQFYRDLDVGREVSDPEEKWGIYSQHFDMTPCKYEEKERFEQCLEDVNSYDYPVYSGVPQRNESVLEVKEVEVPNRTYENEGIRSIRTDFNSIVVSIIDYLSEIVQGLGASF